MPYAEIETPDERDARRAAETVGRRQQEVNSPTGTELADEEMPPPQTAGAQRSAPSLTRSPSRRPGTPTSVVEQPKERSVSATDRASSAHRMSSISEGEQDGSREPQAARDVSTTRSITPRAKAQWERQKKEEAEAARRAEAVQKATERSPGTETEKANDGARQ